jgi:hypothetical protein
VSERGGGIQNDAGGTLTLIASVLRDNAAGVYGGGISNEPECVLIIRNSTLSNDSAHDGGGIGNRGGMLTIIDSTLSDNSASADGGGIWNFGGGTGTILRSTLSGNRTFDGGGIWNIGELTVTDSTLSGNRTFDGGGIWNIGELTVTSSTLSGNTATSGGGILATRTDARTFALDTIIAGNSADSSPDVLGHLESQGHNLIGDGSGGTGFTDTDLVGTAEQPIDPQLQPLGDYGGPTQTMRPLPSSPAVDAGDNPFFFNTDQRGLPRIINFTIDIGSVELQPNEFGHTGWIMSMRAIPEIPAPRLRLDSGPSILGPDALVLRPGLHTSIDPTMDGILAQQADVAHTNRAGYKHLAAFINLPDNGAAKAVGPKGRPQAVADMDPVVEGALALTGELPEF